MSRILIFRILPILVLFIGATCQAQTAYPPWQRPPTSTYPQYYGYDGVAATPVPIPRPIYQRQYPRRYEPNPVAGIPIPIPRPTIEQPTRSYPQYYGFGGQPGNAAIRPAPR